MKYVALFAGALLFIAPCAFGQAVNLEDMDIVLKMIPDGPVAMVNGKPIPRMEFARSYQMELLRITQLRAGERVPDGARVQLGWRTLAELIQQELLHQEAIRKKVVIDPAAAEARWQEQLKQYRQSNPNLDEASVIKAFGAESRQKILDEVARMLQIEKMKELIFAEADVKATEEEIIALYDKDKDMLVQPESLHIRQLFVRGPVEESGGRDFAQKRAKEALGRIQSGQRFEGIVAEFSDSPGKADGGNMGPGPVGQFPPWLAQVALKMKPNDISEIIESDFGFHIIKLISMQEGKQLSLEESRPVLESSIGNQKEEQVLLIYCDKLVTEGSDEVLIFLEMEKNLSINPEYRNLLLQ